MILITGGTGLVGAHLILECLIKNLKIRAIYRSQEKLNEIELFFEKYAYMHSMYRYIHTYAQNACHVNCQRL